MNYIKNHIIYPILSCVYLALLRMKIGVLIMLCMYSTSLASLQFNPRIISELTVLDDFLSTAVLRAKRKYSNNVWGDNSNQDKIENLIDSNVNNYAYISSLILTKDYRIILELSKLHPVIELRGVRIALLASFNEKDLNITRYTCHTDFDKKLRVPFDGALPYGFNGQLSTFTKFLPETSTKEINGCIYIDPDSNLGSIYQY